MKIQEITEGIDQRRVAIGRKVNHPSYGAGRVAGFDNTYGEVTVKYDGSEKPVRHSREEVEKLSRNFKKSFNMNEVAMDRTEIGMGLEQFVGEKYGFYGGMRSGNSKAGLTRLKYMIFDIAEATKDPSSEDAIVGEVHLFIKDGSGDIEGLVNIKLNPKTRRAGIGSSIVKDIVDTAGGTLNIYDVQPKARGFWKKMGIEYTDKGRHHGVIKSAS